MHVLLGHLSQRLLEPKQSHRTPLVAHWIRIRLPMQGTRVRSLVREDSTCCGTAKPVSHNYSAHVLQLLKPTRLEPVLQERSRRNEKPVRCNQRVTPRRHNQRKASYSNNDPAVKT